jgi:hypothetical protein
MHGRITDAEKAVSPSHARAQIPRQSAQNKPTVALELSGNPWHLIDPCPLPR